MPPTLLIAPWRTVSSEGVRLAAERRGLSTVVLDGYDIPDAVVAEHVHAGFELATAAAARFDLGLLEATPTWLADLPLEFVRRRVDAMPIREAYAIRSPVFVKSPNDKQIHAMVYVDGGHLPGPDAVDGDTIVLVSDIAHFQNEYRLHLLDGDVVAMSRYAVGRFKAIAPPSTSALAAATSLATELSSTLPSAVVVDIGKTEDGWAVIESNPAWGSGAYQSDFDMVLAVILRSAGPIGGVRADDRRFLRPLT